VHVQVNPVGAARLLQRAPQRRTVDLFAEGIVEMSRGRYAQRGAMGHDALPLQLPTPDVAPRGVRDPVLDQRVEVLPKCHQVLGDLRGAGPATETRTSLVV